MSVNDTLIILNMDKDSKKTDSATLKESVFELPVLIKNRANYQLLISNRAISYRINMADKLDELFTPKLGFGAWKNRFLDPLKNIPKKEFKEISEAMEEALAFHLQDQTTYIKTQINIINSNKELLETKIQAYNDILEKTEQAIELYKNEK